MGASVANLMIQTQAMGERRATAWASLTGLSDPLPVMILREACLSDTRSGGPTLIQMPDVILSLD